MRDKRPVDELSTEELERILAIRKRQERQKQLDRMRRSGRVIPDVPDRPLDTIPKPGNGVSGQQPPKPVSAASLPAETVDLPASSVARREAAPRFEEDPSDVEFTGQGDKDRVWKTFVNRALLAVEILAVVGLIYIGVTLFNAITVLERETASAQEQANQYRQAALPTIAPTPQLRIEDFVLPGGHKPPQEGGQFNYDEIPAHLVPVVQSQIIQPPIKRPPQTDETALNLIIPKLNVNQTIVQGIDWEALKQGIGQLPNGVNPSDEIGNLVLAGHNDIYGEIFRHLDKLEPGDQLQIQTRTKVYTYTVTAREIVEPTAVQVMETRDGATVTLISCYPYQVNNKRIVVFAKRVDI